MADRNIQKDSEGGVDNIYVADVNSVQGAIDFINDLYDDVFDSYDDAYDHACNY